MALYEYSVWFKNQDADPTDQDYEWVACFLIDATTESNAKDWGDLLSAEFVGRNPSNEFLSSSVSPLAGDQSPPQLPTVLYGQQASDELIGW